MADFFVRRPIVAIVISIVTVLGGLVAMRGLPIAQFPEIVPPLIRSPRPIPAPMRRRSSSRSRRRSSSR